MYYENGTLLRHAEDTTASVGNDDDNALVIVRYLPWSRKWLVVVRAEAGRFPGRRRCHLKYCLVLVRTNCHDVDRSKRSKSQPSAVN